MRSVSPRVSRKVLRHIRIPPGLDGALRSRGDSRCSLPLFDANFPLFDDGRVRYDGTASAADRAVLVGLV